MARQGLDPARVVAEAARIADLEGIEAVTLARVAQALEVRAPSLYNHVDGRTGLLRLLSIQAIGELTERMQHAAIGRAGADALAAVGHAYRAYALAHPGRYAVTVRAPAADDPQLAEVSRGAIEVILAVLAGWGLEGDAALHQVRVIRAALHGFVAIEAAGGFGLPLDLDRSFELVLDTLVAGIDRR